jgi:hypothetical protein
MFCPLCGSARIRRSRTRGFEEKILKPLGFKAFRCRENLCDWRGLLKTGFENETGVLQKCKAPLIFMIMFLLSLLVFVFVISSDFVT